MGEAAVDRDDAVAAAEFPLAVEPAPPPPPVIRDERRMHARAYDNWVSLLRGRRLPRVADLQAERLADFAANSFLVDFVSAETPTLRFMGPALASEAGIEAPAPGLADIPEDALIARLPARLPEIRTQATPLGFEAEHADSNGDALLYRGILLPYTGANGDTVDLVQGVVNWRRMAANLVAPEMTAVVEVVAASRPAAPAVPLPVWGDGPGAMIIEEAQAPLPSGDQRLAKARAQAALAEAGRGRIRSAVNAALAAAYDLGRDPGDLAEISTQEIGRMRDAAVVRLVFGPLLGVRRTADYVAALSHARRLGIGSGMLGLALDRHSRGAQGFAEAERIALASERPDVAAGRDALADRIVLGQIDLRPLDPDFLLLIGRRESDGVVSIVDRVPGDGRLTERALARFAG